MRVVIVGKVVRSFTGKEDGRKVEYGVLHCTRKMTDTDGQGIEVMTINCTPAMAATVVLGKEYRLIYGIGYKGKAKLEEIEEV